MTGKATFWGKNTKNPSIFEVKEAHETNFNDWRAHLSRLESLCYAVVLWKSCLRYARALTSCVTDWDGLLRYKFTASGLLTWSHSSGRSRLRRVDIKFRKVFVSFKKLRLKLKKITSCCSDFFWDFLVSENQDGIWAASSPFLLGGPYSRMIAEIKRRWSQSLLVCSQSARFD